MQDAPVAKYGKFTLDELGVKERWHDPNKKEGPDSHGITQGRKDAFNSMINLLLNHQQEIIKVPACSTLESAQEWCDARPKSGFRAGLAHLNDDRIPEVVVYDRKGAPFIINGYKMKKSDFGLRNAYYEAHPSKEHRAVRSMSEWVNDACWSYDKDPENPYKRTNIEMTQTGRNLKSKGWRIPAKPKKQQSVYSVFCKLIAPYVKKFFSSDYFLALFRNAAPESYKVPPVLAVNPGPSNADLVRRLISPITIYRYLYMKLVLRNYFFQLIAQEKIDANYHQFEEYLKEHKNQFLDWFCNNFLDSEKGFKSFSDARISDPIIAHNMCKGVLNTDGTDVNDGLIFLVGVDNWIDQTPHMLMGEQQIRFIDLIVNNEAAAHFLGGLEAKNKQPRASMAKFKRRAQESAKTFFKDRLKQAFFIDPNAFELWKAGSEAGCFTAGSPEAFQHHVGKAQEDGKKALSPTKSVRDVPENTIADEPVPIDDSDDGM